MRILSLNTNQFSGQGDIKNTSDISSLNTYSKEIIALAKGFLAGNESGIVVLQEIPCWDFRLKKRRALFDSFLGEFSEEIYKIITPLNINAKIITLAITNANSGWHSVNDFGRKVNNFCNRFIEASYRDDVHLLGVHMPINPKNKNDNIDFWKVLIGFSKAKNHNNLIIAGDFNAYIGNCDYEEYYKKILENGYCDVIPEKAVTYKKKTKIDHILISSEMPINKAFCLDEQYSDHAIVVTAEI